MDLSQKEKEPVENRSAKQILIDTANKCQLLIKEANKSFSKGDTKDYKEKLVERAEVIEGLPNQLAKATDIESLPNREEILNEVELWSLSAEKALENRGTIHFGLSLLLSPKDDNLGDKGPFKTLIESIKE